MDHFESQYPVESRFTEIEKILGHVREGNSCQLIGIPGAGRASLLEILAYNKDLQKKHLGQTPTKLHFVDVNFSEIRNRPLSDVMKFIFLNLTESLREEKMTEEHKVVGDKFREHLQFKDELILFQGFKEAVEYLANERKITIVFLFDRFEEYIPTVTSGFFADLRVLRNKAKYHFSVVFSLPRPLEALVEPALLVDFYEYVADRHVFVDLYDKVSTDFRLSYLEKITGKKVNRKIFEEVLALTGGHGKITKQAIESLLANDTHPDNIAVFLLSHKSIRAALKDIWETLSPAEQSYLLYCHAELDSASPSFEIPDYHEGTTHPRGVAVRNDSASEIAEYLEAIGLVKEKKIQMPLFAQFIRTKYNDTEQAVQKIVYDENTNTIRKGSDVLSDQLTSSEFRLLRYLLQNEENVVEREELISVVWQGNKSVAGITDQAVDQLIFRLRRKIEGDPNNPSHLQTVKGRGFKFVS